MRRLSRLFRGFLTGVTVLAFILLVFVVTVETAWFKDWLRGQLVTRVDRVLEGDLRVRRLGGSIWTGVTLEGVELTSATGEVLNAGRIRVRYDPFTLARRRWVIEAVEIDGATINVVRTPTGWNVLELTRKRDTRSTTTVVLTKLILNDAVVRIVPDANSRRVLHDVALESSLTVAEGVMSMKIDSLRAFDETTGVTLQQLTGRAEDNFRTFDVQFAADAGAMKTSGRGRGEMDGSRRVLTLSADTSRLNLAPLTGNREMVTDITGHVEARAEFPAGGSAHMSFAFKGPGSSGFGYTVQQIDADGTLNRDRVRFDARLRAYDASATVDGEVSLPAAGRPATFKGHGRFASLDVSRLPAHLDMPRFASRLTGTYRADVARNRWLVYSELGDSTVEGAAIANGTQAFAQSDGRVLTYAAIGSGRDIDPQRFGRVIPVATLDAPRFSGNLSGRFAVVGQHATGAPPHLMARAILENSSLSGTTLSHLDGLLMMSERRLLVSADGTFEGLNEVTLGNPAVPIAANGRVTGWFMVPDLDRPITEDNLELNAGVALGPSALRGQQIQSAAFTGSLTNGVLTVTSLDVRQEDALVQAEGAIGVHEPSAIGLTVKGELRDRAFLSALIGRPVFAAGSVDAVITGSLDSPAATGELGLREVAYGDDVTALTTNVKFSTEWPDRDVERLSWKADMSSVFVTVGGTEIQKLTAAVVGGLREMAVDIHADQEQRSLGIEGRLTLRPDAQELLLRRLALTTQNIAWSLPANQTATVRYGGDRVSISDLTLIRDAQQIRIAGTFDLETPNGGASTGEEPLRVQLENVQLADVNQMLLGTRRLTGLINGTLLVEGTRHDPAVNGDIEIRDGSVEAVQFLSATTRGRYVNGIATVDALLNQAPGASLRAVGTIPVAARDAGAALDLRVWGGPVNLGLAQAFTTEIDKVAGSASMDVRVTGSLRNPIVNGTASVAGGAFEVGATGVAYTAVEAAVDVKDSQLTIRHLQATDPDGDSLTATGGLDVHRGITSRAIEVRARANGFLVLDNAFGTAEVDAEINVSGELRAPVVRGTISLEAGRLEVARILEQTTADPYRTEPLAPLDAAAKADAANPPVASPLEAADVELTLRLPDNLVLRGRDLRVRSGSFGIGDMNIVTGGEFILTRKPRGPVDLRGTLEVVQGNYSFQGRRFEIERGSDVRFPGGPPTDPLINVTATREVTGITAEVRLRGSLRTPELELASRPPLDEGDILSLIVFNQPVNSLGAAEQVNLGERAAALAAGAITSPLADSIGRALNLDVFEIQAPTSDQGTGSVTIGSQFGSRLLVGLRQQFGNSDASMLTLEYRINKLLRFVTSVASGSLQAHATRPPDRGGVDLIFVIRY